MDFEMDYIENCSPNTIINTKNPFESKAANKASKSEDNSVSSIQSKLTKQIEFYLSDANLINDSFLCKILSKTKQQCVLINTLLTFTKVKSLIKEQFGSGKLFFNDDEKCMKFIRESVKPSKYVRLTKDKLAIQRKIKYYRKKAEENIAFTIRIDGKLPELEQLEKCINQCKVTETDKSSKNEKDSKVHNKICKFNGIYIKSFDENSHCIYIGFLKPRHNECFKKCFESKSIPCFDYSNSKLLTLKECDDMKRRLKKEITKFVDSEICGINTNNIEQEELSTDCFIKISKIPVGTKKHQIREALDCARPSYIDFKDDETAIIRFKNTALRSKFLESRKGAEIFIRRNNNDISHDNSNKTIKERLYQSCLVEELDNALSTKIIEKIKEDRSTIDEIKDELNSDNKKYKPWSKYCKRKNGIIRKRMSDI